MTPRCAAAAVVSAVVLRRPTNEYTHRYSMMHRRLTTAGIEVAPHYHQLLVFGLRKTRNDSEYHIKCTLVLGDYWNFSRPSTIRAVVLTRYLVLRPHLQVPLFRYLLSVHTMWYLVCYSTLRYVENDLYGILV